MNQKQYDNELKGALFKNDKQGNEGWPDYNGNCTIDRVQYWISAWINVSQKDGKKFMKLTFKPKTARDVAKKPAPAAAGSQDFDDDIPF